MVRDMTDLPAVPAGIDAQDWANTPEAIRVVVAEAAALRTENAQLKARLAALEERVRKSSRNSSLPPSSDLPRAATARRKRTPSGRKTGGQPGHAGHGRTLLPPTQVDEVVEVRPLACAACGALLLST
jgi:transposase